MLNGRAALEEILEASSLTAVEAVARYARFLNPQSIQECGSGRLFNARRADKKTDPDSKRRSIAKCEQFYWDDNQVTVDLFCKISDIKKPLHGQFNHIGSQIDSDLYTNPRNIVWTPRFLGYLSDEDPKVKQALEFRSYEVYGIYLKDAVDRPLEYPKCWSPPLAHRAGIEDRFLSYFKNSSSSTTARSARECGWYFSKWEPDPRVPPPRERKPKACPEGPR